MTLAGLDPQPEDLGKELRRGALVLRGHDGVIQANRHAPLQPPGRVFRPLLVLPPRFSAHGDRPRRRPRVGSRGGPVLDTASAPPGSHGPKPSLSPRRGRPEAVRISMIRAQARDSERTGAATSIQFGGNEGWVPLPRHRRSEPSKHPHALLRSRSGSALEAHREIGDQVAPRVNVVAHHHGDTGLQEAPGREPRGAARHTPARCRA
jgi:hypothetical protein